MNKITVLMPSYNRGQYIEQAVNSVLNQKANFDFKLIITDDCSTDGSVETVKELQRTHPDKIEIILSDENERLLANILKAQMQVKTEYFCVLDPDDYYIDENFLQKAVNYLDGHKDFTIYSSNCLMLFDNQTTKPYIETKITDAVFTFNDLLEDSAIITQTAGSVFRNVVYKNGIPDIIQNAIGTESESSFRADTERYIFHLHEGKSFFKNEQVATYRIHSEGIWTKTNQFKRNVLAAQAYYDYCRYFNFKYPEYFIEKSIYFVKESFNELNTAIDKNVFTNTVDIADISQLINIMSENEKYFNTINSTKNKILKKLTFRRIVKSILPYGLVRLLQLWKKK